MVSKDGLQIIKDRKPTFYNRLFLVEKTSCGWKTLLDILPVNSFMVLFKFRMEAVASVLASIKNRCEGCIFQVSCPSRIEFISLIHVR